MDFYLPNFEIITEIHEVVLEVSGGKSGIHVASDIHRAVERPKTYTTYVDDFTIDTLCAILIDSLARYHGFNDGNKRTALMTALVTYRLNGVNFRPTQAMNQEFDLLVMWVVEKKPAIPEIEQQLHELRVRYQSKSKQPMTRVLSSFAKMRKSK